MLGAGGKVLTVDFNENKNLDLFSSLEQVVKDSKTLVYRSLAAGRPQWWWLEGAGLPLGW